MPDPVANPVPNPAPAPAPANPSAPAPAPANPAPPDHVVVHEHHEHQPAMVPVKNLVVTVAVLAVVGLGIWATVNYWPKEEAPKEEVTKARASGRHVQEQTAVGAPGEEILNVPRSMEEDVQIGSFKYGRRVGLEAKGIRTVTLEQLEDIADSAIDRYRFGSGDRHHDDVQDGPQRDYPQPSLRDADQSGTQKHAPPPGHQGTTQFRQPVPMRSVVIPHQSVQQPGARVILQQNLQSPASRPSVVVQQPQQPVVNRPRVQSSPANQPAAQQPAPKK